MKIELENAVVYQGSNLDVLPTLPDNSVDSIVTDPPYELGFMGKSWDNSGIAYSVELWTECMRVLKPGGHLLAFGGSRTWHRLAVAIEDAGFEMRDSIAWLYGSGFPKSLDVSKAIDKQDATEARVNRNLAFTTWMRSTELTRQKATELLRDAGVISENGTMAGHFFAETMAGQPAVATAELFDVLRPYLPEVPDYIEQMVAERTIESQNFKNREVIGSKTSGIANKNEKERHTIGASKAVEVDITAPATPEAQKWQGWGTALKPAFEPVVVARKPLEEKTVAANVLKYGTGGLNIDGSRIGIDLENEPNARPNAKNHNGHGSSFSVNGENSRSKDDLPDAGFHNSAGRWPANIILDPYTAELLDEQSGISKPKPEKIGPKGGSGFGYFDDEKTANTTGRWPEDLGGGASRFFYVAKASKKDRNEGLDELPIASSAELVDRQEGSAGMNSPRAGAGRTSGSANIHPTVKPTTLMEYLIKLVTPPNGTVLDPFTGSGSTGKAALLSGFKFIGIELTEEYLPIIEGRLKWASEQVSKEKDEVLF